MTTLSLRVVVVLTLGSFGCSDEAPAMMSAGSGGASVQGAGTSGGAGAGGAGSGGASGVNAAGARTRAHRRTRELSSRHLRRPANTFHEKAGGLSLFFVLLRLVRPARLDVS